MSQLFQNEWRLLPERVAIHLPTRTGVVADLHLGYSETRRSSGEAVPLFDLPRMVEPLLKALRLSGAKSLVVAGDLFERFFEPELLANFRQLLDDADVTLAGIALGNHDRRIAALQGYEEEVMIGNWRVVHGDSALPTGPVVAGHFHPCTRYRGRKVPCFMSRGDRLILPAYSPDASGVDLNRQVAWRDFQRWAIVAGQIVPMKPKSLRSARSTRSPEAHRLNQRSEVRGQTSDF